jgi:hypothetical protein
MARGYAGTSTSSFPILGSNDGAKKKLAMSVCLIPRNSEATNKMLRTTVLLMGELRLHESGELVLDYCAASSLDLHAIMLAQKKHMPCMLVSEIFRVRKQGCFPSCQRLNRSQSHQVHCGPVEPIPSYQRHVTGPRFAA